MSDDTLSGPGELHSLTDTQHEFFNPPEALTQAAMRLIPPALADMANASDNPGPDPAPGLKVVRYSQIIQALRDRGQPKDVAAAAIRQLIGQGMIKVRQPGPDAPVFTFDRRGRSGGTMWPNANESAALEDCLIESTPQMCQWWAKLVEETETPTRRPVEQPAKPNPFRQLCALVLQIREQELARDLKSPRERSPQTTEFRAEMKNQLLELVADCWAAGRSLGDGREREAEEAAKQLAEGCTDLLLWEHAVRLGRLSAEEAAKEKGGPCVVLVNRLYPAYDRVDHFARLFDRISMGRASGENKKSGRMTVEEANKKAMELARRMKGEFFLLSTRKQATRIGCSFETWTKTPLYPKAQKQRLRLAGRIGNRPSQPSPAPVSFTNDLEAVKGEGTRDEVLKQLVAAEEQSQPKPKWDDLSDAEQQQLLSAQEADHEPSPLEDDPKDRRPRVVRSRKRL